MLTSEIEEEHAGLPNLSQENYSSEWSRGHDLRSKIEKIVTFNDLLPDSIHTSYSEEESLQELDQTYPFIAPVVIDGFVEAVAGSGDLNIAKRNKVLEAFIFITEPLTENQPEVKARTSLTVENLKKDRFGFEYAVTSAIRNESELSVRKLQAALAIDPSLKGRILHMYALIEAMSPTKRDRIDRILERTTVGDKEEEIVRMRCDLFAKGGGKINRYEIPEDAHLSEEELRECIGYSQIDFTVDMSYLFAKNMRLERYRRAKELADLATTAYTMLKEKGEARNYIGQNKTLWYWSSEHFDILQAEFATLLAAGR